MTRAFCEELRTRYFEAAKDYCRPSPVITAEVIEVEPGEAVLAVNVEPAPGLLVGAAAVNGGKIIADAWRFYMRIGNSHAPVTPERLPLLIDARVRRIAIAFDEMAALPHAEAGTGAQIQRKLLSLQRGQNLVNYYERDILSMTVSLRENRVTFMFRHHW